MIKQETYEARLKTKSMPQLKRLAVENFHTFIRERDSDTGMFCCISCSKWKAVDQMTAGHYYPSTHTATKFHELNVNGQCVKCNTYLHGNLKEYRIGLEKKIGQKGLDELDWKHSQRAKLDRYSLMEIIIKYKYA